MIITLGRSRGQNGPNQTSVEICIMYHRGEEVLAGQGRDEYSTQN